VPDLLLQPVGPRWPAVLPGVAAGPRRRAERALATVVATSYLLGVSTRRGQPVTGLARHVGGVGAKSVINESQ